MVGIIIIASTIAAVRAKEAFFQYQLMIAAKASQDVYEKEYLCLNNLSYARKINRQITIQQIFKNHWDEFKKLCRIKNKHIRNSILIKKMA